MLDRSITCPVGSVLDRLFFVLLEHEHDDLDDAMEINEPIAAAAFMLDWDRQRQERRISTAENGFMPIKDNINVNSLTFTYAYIYTLAHTQFRIEVRFVLIDSVLRTMCAQFLFACH